MSKTTNHPLTYDPASLRRETSRHYIAAGEDEIRAMLKMVGAEGFNDLYRHIPSSCRFDSAPDLPEEMDYDELLAHLESLAERNHTPADCFIVDGLPWYEVHPIVAKVSSIRNLATAYTPYQPERSQGTLMTHWIYQCTMSKLTGFEAINSSLYDRSTAMFEAICAAIRMNRKARVALVCGGVFPADLEVVRTLAIDTGIEIDTLPLDPVSGRANPDALEERIALHGANLAAVVFPQVNSLGLLEDVDSITRIVHLSPAQSIAVVDPMLLATGGLKAPTDFGDEGVDMIVGEAQHLAIGPNFGGPGLGLFGVRHNEKVRNAIRQTPGRYVGKAVDAEGRDCLVMVLSTREQHIRKDKATSNICSNQAFLATLAGAAILARGETGMQSSVTKARESAINALQRLCTIPGISPAFPETPFFNELILEICADIDALIERGAKAGLHIGINVSQRVGGNRSLLKLGFTDREVDTGKLIAFLAAELGEPLDRDAKIPSLPKELQRAGSVNLPSFSLAEIEAWYERLGHLNVSPDDGCYPLGSCTMKYNPFLNEWAAGLPGFTDIHPQAPLSATQGCLEILFQVQEWFRHITGLAGVTTQPVAGAQGELVGIKLFQAYHRHRGEAHRDVILIPDSAHGTNFATAVMAGYPPKKTAEGMSGMVLLASAPDGTVDMADLDEKLSTLGDRLAGIMITNPNTCGIFEHRFREIAEKVHAAGGLVYMDGANMNAIAGWCDLGKMGVDAVHNNLHKTWTIPHGGGGPGDAIVAVSERLVPFLPGVQIERSGDQYVPVRPKHSIGSFHRHWGNFAHKVRAYAYLRRLGREGVPRMTAMAVLSARYCFEMLRKHYPTLPAAAKDSPRMHEFILTISEEDFARIEKAGVPRAMAITRIGKLFLDFGFHAPTVAWPETFGLMIEPTESYSKGELDRFCEAVSAIRKMIVEHPEVLNHVPLFTPVDRIDEVAANRQLRLSEPLNQLPELYDNRVSPVTIGRLPVDDIYRRILDTVTAFPSRREH